jgi:heme/copper-type cytochrome/quinol oxidase subunit 3
MAQDTVDNQQFESFPQLKETPEEIAFELRAQEGALWTGGKLVIGIWAFAFAALAFAYFYLRSANNEDLWRPRGVTAPTAVGAAIFAVTVASALLVQYGDRRFRNNETLDWQVAGWTAVLGGLLAVALQVWQLTFLPFFPGSSGYASCFIAWASLNIALLLSGV